MEIRIGSGNKDNSHSWVRISHGLNKLVTDLSNKEDDDNERETSDIKFEEFALKTNVLAFASRSKAKAKPRRRISVCSSTRTVPICERSWTDIEPRAQSNRAYPVAKRLNTLLRHEYRALDKIDGEPMEFEWNIFPRFTTLQLCHKVQELMPTLSVTPEKFTGRIIFMSMFNDISWRSKDNKKECESNARLISL